MYLDMITAVVRIGVCWPSLLGPELYMRKQKRAEFLRSQQQVNSVRGSLRSASLLAAFSRCFSCRVRAGLTLPFFRCKFRGCRLSLTLWVSPPPQG